MYGFPPCQVGYNPDGSTEDPVHPPCVNTVTNHTPPEFVALFVGSQWLHANLMTPVMALPLARNCPHELAPSGYGKDRGFMMRIFFPLNETDVPYPPGGLPPRQRLGL